MSPISAEQRRLNLMIALSATRHRLTREQIRDTVDGYEPQQAGADEAERRRADAAFQRMFERDKDELRRLGLPLRTITDPTHQDDLGYRIDGDRTMPELGLTIQDAAVLALAVEYWRGKALAGDARQGYSKLISSIEHSESPTLPYGGMAGSAGSDATAVLAEAVAQRQVVRFEYASASSDTRVRTVEPWGIVMRSGLEYLIGRDADRGEERIFRVGRIVGRIRAVGELGAYDRPETLPLGALADDAPPEQAVVALRPEAGHALRRRGEPVGERDGWELVRVPYRHADVLLAEVLATSGGARVVEPVELAEAARDHARAALEVSRG